MDPKDNPLLHRELRFYEEDGEAARTDHRVSQGLYKELPKYTPISKIIIGVFSNLCNLS